MLRKLMLILAILLLSKAAIAAEKVDVEIVLLLDSSGSINITQLQAQRQAVRDSLVSENVIEAIQNNFYQKIAINIVEYASDLEKTKISDWTVISGYESAKRLAETIPHHRYKHGSTMAGAAFTTEYDSMMSNDIESSRQVMILSTQAVPDDPSALWAKVMEFRRNNNPKLNVFTLPVADNEVLLKAMIPWYYENISYGNKRISSKFDVYNLERFLVRAIEDELM